MKVLVACEFSGAVRDAFIARGHDAVSVDLLPTESPGPHIQGDILGWDMDFYASFDLMIAHPPCTYLANSGVKWLYGGKGTTVDPVRWKQMEDGAYLFARLLRLPVRRIAVENPIMHGHARRLIESDAGTFPVQTVQPWMFGHGETKATQFWLKGLPPLVPTHVVDGREQRIHLMPPGPGRGHERSKTYPGIAAAMAEQWGR